MFQRQIYPRSEETRREHKTTNLHLETRSRPWVLVHDETPNVADHFTEYAKSDGEHECPCSFPCSDDELREEEDAEEYCEESVCAQVRIVAVERTADGTVWRHGDTKIVVVLWHVVGGQTLSETLEYRLLNELAFSTLSPVCRVLMPRN